MARPVRALSAGVIAFLSILVPAGASAPTALPPGSLVQLSGTAGCVTVGGAFGCARGRGFTGYLGHLHSLSITADGRHVYAGGDGFNYVFRRNSETGRLTQLAGAHGCLVSNLRRAGCRFVNGVFSAGQVALGPEGRTAYAPASIDLGGGVLTSFSATVVPFRRDPRSGVLRQAAEAPACVMLLGTQRCARGVRLLGHGAIVSHDGRNLYLMANESTWVFRRDPASGELAQVPTPEGCIKKSGFMRFECREALAGAAVEESPDGRHLYAISSSRLVVFRRDASEGLLEPVPGRAGCVSTPGQGGPCATARGLQGLLDLAISGDGRHVYAVSALEAKGRAPQSRAVTVFRRDRSTGRLTQLSGRAGCISHDGSFGCSKGRALFGAYDVTVSPDGRNVYTASVHDAGVAVFRRDRATGALTQLPGTAGCLSVTGTTFDSRDRCARARLSASRGVRVSPDGRNVYVVSNHGISVFKRMR